MGVEERDHREHPPVVVVGLGQAELRQDVVDVLLNGALRDPEAPPDAGIGAPLGHQREHVALATGELVERILDIAGHHEFLNQSRVDHRPATAHSSDGIEELIDVGNATLEQVAGAAPAREQRHRVLHLDVCREDQERRLGELFANRPGCLESLRPMGGRHADIHDRESGLLLFDQPHQFRGVTRLADDLVPAPLEQAGEALAHQHVIVGDDDSRTVRIDLGHRESIPQHDRRNYAAGADCLPPVRALTGPLAGRWRRSTVVSVMPSPSVAVEAGTDLLGRARQIQRSWERLLGEGALGSELPPQATAGMRPTIVDSWRRTLATGLDPTDLLAPIEAEEPEVRERWLEHPLGSAAHVLVAQLRAVAEETHSLLVVTDASGLLLHVDGADWLKDRAREMNLLEGARYSETTDGTNGIGTALAADHALQVFAFEHFNQRHHEWVCSAAPVHDPRSRRIVGLLDLSSLWKIAHPRSLELVTTAAKTVERCLWDIQRDRKSTRLNSSHIL